MVISMKNNSVYGFTVKSAVKKLHKWKSNYLTDSQNVKIRFSNKHYLGNGYMETSIDNEATLVVGMAPLSLSFPERYFPLNDLNFTIMGVTLFHELRHYKCFTSDITSKEIQISNLSKCYNEDYYHAVHHKLPHEIGAEFTGVMSMWSALESEWPEHADRLIFEYLDYRTMSSDQTKKLYMIERPDGGFKSKQQVKDLFNEAYEKSLTEKRRLPDNFPASDDDVSRLIATDDGRAARTEYVPVYLKLSKSETGADTDQMMASLITHMHPELQNMYDRIDFDELRPEKVFDMVMPETTDESRARLGYGGSFADSVDYVTKLQTDEPCL